MLRYTRVIALFFASALTLSIQQYCMVDVIQIATNLRHKQDGGKAVSKIYKEATFEAAIEHHLITEGATSAATLKHSTVSAALIPPYPYHLFYQGAHPDLLHPLLLMWRMAGAFLLFRRFLGVRWRWMLEWVFAGGGSG